MRYRFAEHLLDLRRGSLSGPAGAIHLRPQAMKLLEVLVARAPEMVPRDQLLDEVWGTRHLSAGSLKQAISELRQALGDPPGGPLYIETVHRRGYRFIAPVAIEAVLPVAAPAVAALPAAAPVTEPPPAAGPARSGRRPLRLALAALAALLLAGGVYLLARPAAPPSPPAAPETRPVAALFVFAAEAPADGGWAPVALAELLAVELASGGGLQVVAGDEVARLRRELAFDPAAELGRRQLERIRAYLGCDLVLRGRLTLAGNEARLALAVIDARSARETFAATFGARGDDFAGLARAAAARLHAEVVPPALPEDAAGRRWESPGPSRGEALRLYAQGLAQLRAGEAVAARDLLLQAAAGDPGNALIQRDLARAHQELGYGALALAAAQRAAELAGGLPREVRLGIEGQLHLARRDFGEAAAVYGALHRFFPDDLDHGLRLAAALAKSQQPGPAAEVLAQLRRLPPPRGDDPQIDLQEAALCEASDLPRALAAARAAARQASARGALQLLARSRRDEGWLLYRLARYDEALTALGEAEAVFRAGGDLAKVASVLAARATVLASHGDRAEARAAFETAARICREIGNPGSEAQVLNNFASFVGTDDLPLSGALLRRAIAIKEELGDPAGEALSRLNLANLERFTGNLAAARELTRGALELYRRTGEKLRIAFALRTLGSLLVKEGRLGEATEAFTEALAISRAAGDARGEGDALYELGNLRLARRDEEGAMVLLRQSREIYERIGLVDDAVLSDLQIGDILWVRGEREAGRELYRALAAQRSRIGSERIRGMLDQRLAGGPPAPAATARPARRAAENPRRQGA